MPTRLCAGHLNPDTLYLQYLMFMPLFCLIFVFFFVWCGTITSMLPAVYFPLCPWEGRWEEGGVSVCVWEREWWRIIDRFYLPHCDFSVIVYVWYTMGRHKRKTIACSEAARKRMKTYWDRKSKETLATRLLPHPRVAQWRAGVTVPLRISWWGLASWWAAC